MQSLQVSRPATRKNYSGIFPKLQFSPATPYPANPLRDRPGLDLTKDSQIQAEFMRLLDVFPGYADKMMPGAQGSQARQHLPARSFISRRKIF
jgi:hypothetical protein